MPHQTLNNCCLEVAIQHALKKKFPDIDVQFNHKGNAKNDHQIIFEQIATLSNSDSLKSYDLTVQKIPDL